MSSLELPGTTAAPLRPLPPVRPWLAVWALGWREIVRFLRQRNRVIGAIGQPVLFWLLFGAGLSRSFRLSDTGQMAGQSFHEYYFPGTLTLILLFTAIFSTISIIEDRREGFLQSVLVAPIPRWSMVLGKILGGSLIAMFQGLIFLALAFTLPITLNFSSVLGVIALMAVVSVGLTALGFVIAWRMDSTQGFHAIMSILLMPMWLLSGAFFPVPVLDRDATWVQWGMYALMRINPLTYGVSGFRRLLFGRELGDALGLATLETSWIVMLGFAGVMFAAAWFVAGGRTTGDML